MLETCRPSGEADPFAKDLAAYLRSTLHIDVSVSPCDGAGRMPVFLVHRYRFYEGRIAGHPCLFMGPLNGADMTPLDIARHVSLVRQAFEGLVVFAASHVSSAVRARLLTQGVAFVVPGNQLYIPQLAMDLREHFRAPERTRGDHLSPVAQAVLFDHVLRRSNEIATPSAIAEQLHYSAMSVGRAFDELSARKLASVERRGREKILTFNAAPRALIETSRTLLRTPVRGRRGVRFTREHPPFMWAGETALAALTDLNPPRVPTFAIEGANWTMVFAKSGIDECNESEEAEAFIETWRYNPRSLSKGHTVDPLSLYAAYWDHEDERVAQAAAQLLERIA
jgi:hypothetical protein